MPKLLLVGLVERVCLKTVVREIPGITDCFMHDEDAKNGGKIYSVGSRRLLRRTILMPSHALGHDKRIEYSRTVAVCI